MATNTWQNGSTYNDRYYNAFSYDANACPSGAKRRRGNILTQVRHNEAGTRVENLSYKYERDANGRLLRNRLYHVNETVSAGAFTDDIDDQGVFSTTNINTSNNYGYDEEGRLIRDDQEDIQEIKWTVGSKVKEVIRTNGSPKKNLKFDYDAFGKRIAKHVYTSANVWESSTYYSYDATGNVMSIYEKKNDGAGITYHAAERYIYGSSRVGTIKERVELSGTITLSDTGNFVHHIGKKQYELNNHLGNVLSTISDRLIAKDWNSDNTTDSYKAEILSATDYTPFGVAMDGRTYAGGNSRYGFNGQEKDDDWNVDGGSYDFGDRIYDSRLARWMLQDPFSKRYASKSPYSTMSNSPLTIIDLNGDTITNVFYKQIYTYKEDGTFQVTTWKTIYINFEDGDPNSNTTYYWVEYEQYLTNGWSSSGNYRVSGEAQWQVEEDYRFSYNERHPKGVAANEYDMTKGSSDGGLMGKNKGNNGESIGETWEKMGGSNGYAPWNVLEEALKELLDGNGGTNGSEEAPDNSRKDEFRDPKTIKHGDTAIILDPSQQDGPGNVVVGDTTGEKTGSNGLKNVPVRIIRQASKADHQRFGSGVNK